MKTRTRWFVLAALVAASVVGLVLSGAERTAAATHEVDMPGVSARSTPSPEPGMHTTQAAGAVRRQIHNPTVISAAVLQIIDAASHTPIDGATVRIVTRSARQDFTATTHEGGRIDVPDRLRGALAIEVRHADYATLRGTLQMRDATTRVALELGGAVELQIVDAEGHPVPEAAAVLLPPLRNGSWLADWTRFHSDEPEFPALVERDGAFGASKVHSIRVEGRTISACLAGVADTMGATFKTNEQGRIRWQNLPALEGYRWGLVPPRPGNPRPAHENHRLTLRNGAIDVRPGPPPGLSGKFAVRAGASTEVGATVLAPGRVRGRLPGAIGDKAALVRLFRITRLANPSASDVVCFDFAAITRTNASGAFSFENVRPGDSMIRASWCSKTRDIYFANETFRVPPAADLDLGDIRALTGASLAVRVGITDGDGRPVAPRNVLAGSPA